MGFMRRLLPLAAALSLVAVSSVQAEDLPTDFDEFVRLSVLKQNSGGLVQDAFGALPSSDMQGTLNRISALYHRAALRNIETFVEDDAETPVNFDRGIESALDDLQADLSAAISAFEPGGGATCGGEGQMHCAEAQFIILQAMKHVLLDRAIQVWAESSRVACGCDDCGGSGSLPCGIVAIDKLNELVRDVPQSWLNDISNLLNDRGHDLGAADLIPAEGGAPELQSAINGLVERAHGEPIIDSRAIGVPSIDF